MRILDRLGLLGFCYLVLPYLEIANPYRFLVNLPYRWREAPDRFPLPPIGHRVLVASADISWFLRGGALSVQSMIEVLRNYGFNIDKFERILDFGCGCGRIIRHLKSRTRAQLYGTDYNPELINWCKRHLTFGNFSTNAIAPPLTYVEDYFDFVYASSVFTHLPEDLQLSWIMELSRVLKPHGILLMTTHGHHYLGRLNREEQEEFRSGRLIIKRAGRAGTNLCTAFHPEAYVRQTLAKGFEIMAFIPEGAKGSPYQDIYLLRKVERY